jgi:hypothetical protein
VQDLHTLRYKGSDLRYYSLSIGGISQKSRYGARDIHYLTLKNLGREKIPLHKEPKAFPDPHLVIWDYSGMRDGQSERSPK